MSDKRKKKTINDMPPGWWADHLTTPQANDTPQIPDAPVIPPTQEETADALKELGDINCVGIMVGDLLKAIELLMVSTETSERQRQTLRRLRPLVAAANFHMRKAGMIAYDAGIRPIDGDQQTS